ncbi:MAG: pgdA [Pseudonocardia sp.]|uniref:polysaccharide deacetylase family protein n=1 Tax=Pseudonocardia sp. TaxID=60912 RepID=UPI002630296A|nr:polysaccharide deacetylase family protein [Pseudonocardia sp.]MCU1626291.1 pgdA [Pseudonocardia sp.]MDT7702838.1 peptidoglycan-N-acetylglucosamine deacetylase [Pseudonocardiales bacterium]
MSSHKVAGGGRAGFSPWAWLAFLAACGFVAAALTVSPPTGGTSAPAAVVVDQQASTDEVAAQSSGGAARPLANDCSGGTVHFTFDDGPNVHTPLLLDRLAALHLKATFFVMGERVAGREQIIRREVAEGHSVQNHSYRHFNLVTGTDLAGVGRTPWGASQIEFELIMDNRVITAAGAPTPTQYRPPYGSVNLEVDKIATKLGLRLIMPWSDHDDMLFDDSHDTEAGVTADVVARNVLEGLHPNSIITMHDGEQAATLHSTAALQPIVDAMNERHMCASTELPADSTGGVFSAPGRGGSSGHPE